MERKPINWTDERIEKAKQAISESDVIKFRNEPSILYLKEPGWFISNPETVGIVLSKVRIDMLPDDMDFAETGDYTDYNIVRKSGDLTTLMKKGALSSQRDRYGNDETVIKFGYSDVRLTWTYAGVGEFKNDDRHNRKDVSTSRISVIYFDKTHEDCGFKNTPVKERLNKTVELFKSLNLYPYVEDDDDNYALADGEAPAIQEPTVNMQLVNSTMTVINAAMTAFELSDLDKLEIVKLMLKNVELTSEVAIELMKLMLQEAELTAEVKVELMKMLV